MINSFQWMAVRVPMPCIDVRRTEDWIVRVAKSHKRIIGEITYIFCDDEEILRVNREFLNHDYYTDIITFDNSLGKLLRGDIYVSLDTVATNAAQLGIDYETELNRVIIHGILHMCGINDKGPGEREIMEKNEDAALRELKSEEHHEI